MNTSSTESSVPCILIVENEPGTVSNLKNKLEGAIPGVTVESAETVVDGQEKLNTAYDHQRCYDVAILDFKLPHDKSSPNEVGDFTLGFLRDSCPDTLVIHMTAKPDDPDFQRVRPAPNTSAAANRLYFGKDDYDWAQKLVAACVKRINEKHSKRIRAEFERLFGQERTSRRLRALGGQEIERGDRGRSLDFVLFCQDAAQHWKQLDQELRDLLSQTVGHTTYEGRDVVGVVTQDDSVPDESPEKPS